MTVNFKPLGVDDETSGMIGVVSCFSSCVVALIIAFFSDKFIWMKKHFKVLMSFFRNKRFVLNETFLRITSKFDIFYFKNKLM